VWTSCPKARRLLVLGGFSRTNRTRMTMIVKTKARLVAQGFTQREGVDCSQASAPTPAASSVKILLAVANELKDRVHLDTKEVSIQAELDCEVYMKLSGGCDSLSARIVRPGKAVYGLRQSGLLWNEQLVKKLVVRMGMEQCKTDPCVFRKIRDSVVVLMVVVHVDDMAEAGTEDKLRKLHEVLHEHCITNDLGGLSLFTVCVVSQDVEKVHLTITQPAFIETVGKRFDVTTTSNFPAVPGENLEARKEGEPGGPWAYREAVGSLIWLRHRKAVLKIIHDSLGSKHLGLTFERGLGLEMTLWTDSNYAEKVEDRRSLSGIAIMLCFTVVAWMSLTQRITAVSATEAEYISMGDGVKEAL
ncbi:unnamed protein product, partial [Hapterophycus canaliculatus]